MLMGLVAVVVLRCDERTLLCEKSVALGDGEAGTGMAVAVEP